MNYRSLRLRSFLMVLSGVAGGALIMIVVAAAAKGPTIQEQRQLEAHQQAHREEIAAGDRAQRAKLTAKFLSKVKETNDRAWVAALRDLKLPPDEGLPVFEGLLDHENPEIKAEALYALGQLYGPAAAPALKKVLQVYAADDDLPAYEAARALALMGAQSADAIPVLIEKLRSGAASQRCEEATIAALGGLGPAARAALPVLEKKLPSPRSAIAYAAYMAIGAIRNQPLLTPQEVLVAGSGVFRLPDGYRALKSLTQTGVPAGKAKALLCELLGMKDLPVAERILALETLRALGPADAESVAQLLASVSSADELVANTAVAAMAQFIPDSPATMKMLADALVSPNDRVGRTAAETLTKSGSSAVTAVPQAIQALQSSRDGLRSGALLDLLRSIGPAAAPATAVVTSLLPENAPAYQGMPPDFAMEVRATALLTLASIGITFDALPAIVDVLANTDQPKAFAAAARAAAALPAGPERARLVPYLMRALEDNYRDTLMTFDRFAIGPFSGGMDNTTARLEAIRAIVKIGRPAAEVAVPLLRKRAKDEWPAPAGPASHQSAAAAAAETLSR